jgi:hypothetical protein
MIAISDYRKHKAVNVSTLKQLFNPRWIKWRLDNPDAEDEEKSHFRIGGAIDTLLTNKKAFNDLYMIGTLDRPGGLMAIFIDSLPLDLTEESQLKEYEEAYIRSGYSIPLTLVVKRLWENPQYRAYYLNRKQAEGKSIISAEEYEQVNYCSNQLLNNAYTRRYFQNINPSIRLIHQAVVLFNWNNIACKGALDGLMIDYEKKKISPFDLKTTAQSVLGFSKSFFNYGYYLQGAFYVEGLKKVFKDTPELFLDYFDLPKSILGFEIDRMRFIVTEKKPSVAGMPAFIYTTPEHFHNVGVNGGIVNGRYYKGFTQYLEDWKYHLETDYWDYSKEYLDNKGEFEITIQ